MLRNKTITHNKLRSSTPLLCAVALLLSVALLSACKDTASNNGNGDSDDGSGSSDVTPSASTAVTDVTISNITPTALTLNWTNPADSDGFQGVLISAEPAGGTAAMPQQQIASATTAEITDLNPITTYSFTLTSMYTDDRKNNAIPTPPTMTATSANLPIDADGDELIDITSLERLNNIRYNLDLSGGLYKTSEADGGVQCGAAQDMPCTGYELIISLDFANPNHYESGTLNAAWRPNSMANNSGTILPQTMADTGTNNGWDPIGTIGDGNRFNSRFEGNGHTISNLYIRRTANVGLFGETDSASVIRSVGVAAVRLYRSTAIDGTRIGALVAVNRGIIVTSYASGAVIGSTNNTVGGLVSTLTGINGAVIASYAAVSINDSDGNNNDVIGGLIGFVNTGPSAVIASYANAIINDGNGTIGGLIGESVGSTIIRGTYASGMIRGSGGGDIIGGLIGSGSRVVASYATSTVDGGEGSDLAGILGGLGPGAAIASYGFGAIMNEESAGIDGTTPRPNDIARVGSGIAGARMLTLDTAGPEWNDATELTLNAWDFGNSTQAPVLRYADYDGDGDKYGCIDASTPTSTATIVIPSVVATPTGPKTIICGTTLLPEQVR